MPMKILVINGPNLNMLGKRDPEHYGTDTLPAIGQALIEKSQMLGCQLVFYQSNHEGAIIDFIQAHAEGTDGILINPAALTHYGYSLHDALVDAGLPVVEVHLSDIKSREEWRQKSVIADIAIKQFSGLKKQSYILGLEALVKHIKGKKR
jgi:3-dehydroquinate dehydratase-2